MLTRIRMILKRIVRIKTEPSPLREGEAIRLEGGAVPSKGFMTGR